MSVRALIDLAGFDGDIVVGGEEGRTVSMPRACPRRPALIVEVLDGPERGADSLVMIVSLSSSELRVHRLMRRLAETWSRSRAEASPRGALREWRGALRTTRNPCLICPGPARMLLRRATRRAAR